MVSLALSGFHLSALIDMKIRTLTRRHARTCFRHTTRYTTRFIGGASRPPRVDAMVLFCRLYKRILKIDESLKPFLEEQFRAYEQHQHQQEVQTMLQRVYGQDSKPNTPKPPLPP